MTYRERLNAAWDRLDISIVQEITGILQRSRSVFVIGNGGSQSTAQHLVLHLRENDIFAVDAMADNAYFTMLSNDYAYDIAPTKYAETWLNGNGNPQTVFAISGSGDSENVLDLLRWARCSNVSTVGLYGFGGGKAARLTDSSVCLTSKDYGIIEDVHLSIVHMIAEALRA